MQKKLDFAYLGRFPAFGMIFHERVMVTFLCATRPLPSSQKQYLVFMLRQSSRAFSPRRMILSHNTTQARTAMNTKSNNDFIESLILLNQFGIALKKLILREVPDWPKGPKIPRSLDSKESFVFGWYRRYPRNCDSGRRNGRREKDVTMYSMETPSPIISVFSFEIFNVNR